MSAKNTDLAAKIVELTTRVAELAENNVKLEHQFEGVRAEKETAQRQVTTLTEKKEKLMEKYAKAMVGFANSIGSLAPIQPSNLQELAKERDEELQNRKNIIDQLRVEAGKPHLPDGFEKEIENQLERIYATMSGVVSKMHKKA